MNTRCTAREQADRVSVAFLRTRVGPLNYRSRGDREVLRGHSADAAADGVGTRRIDGPRPTGRGGRLVRGTEPAESHFATAVDPAQDGGEEREGRAHVAMAAPIEGLAREVRDEGQGP